MRSQQVGCSIPAIAYRKGHQSDKSDIVHKGAGQFQRAASEDVTTNARLDRAYKQRDSGLAATKFDHLLKNLHGDPRYTALLKKLQLPI